MSFQRLLITGTNSPTGGFLFTGWFEMYKPICSIDSRMLAASSDPQFLVPNIDITWKVSSQELAIASWLLL